MERQTRVIGVISGKGGVGKSTITANLGASLAMRYRKEVVIIDCNLSTSHLSLSLGMYYCPVTLNNVLRVEKTVSESMYAHTSGMKIIPASLHLREIEGVDMTDIKRIVQELEGKVDYILLDASPGLGRETYATIHSSQELILVTNPNMPSISDVIKCREILKDLGKKPIGIVLNMVKGKDYEMKRKEIEAMTELPVVASVPQDENIPRSLANKKPVVMYRPISGSSREFNRLAGWLVGEKRRGFFARLFGQE